MLTKKQVLQEIKAGRKSACEEIDSRDYSRLAKFFDAEDLEVLGFKIKDGAEHKPNDWTQKNILDQLRRDVEFGFEKALNQRGISSSLMYEVVKMWMWAMEDELQNHNDYAMYGLPLFKAVAVKYGFENPIGDDNGDERKYDSEQQKLLAGRAVVRTKRGAKTHTV